MLEKLREKPAGFSLLQLCCWSISTTEGRVWQVLFNSADSFLCLKAARNKINGWCLYWAAVKYKPEKVVCVCVCDPVLGTELVWVSIWRRKQVGTELKFYSYVMSQVNCQNRQLNIHPNYVIWDYSITKSSFSNAAVEASWTKVYNNPTLCKIFVYSVTILQHCRVSDHQGQAVYICDRNLQPYFWWLASFFLATESQGLGQTAFPSSVFLCVSAKTKPKKKSWLWHVLWREHFPFCWLWWSIFSVSSAWKLIKRSKSFKIKLTVLQLSVHITAGLRLKIDSIQTQGEKQWH